MFIFFVIVYCASVLQIENFIWYLKATTIAFPYISLDKTSINYLRRSIDDISDVLDFKMNRFHTTIIQKECSILQVVRSITDLK